MRGMAQLHHVFSSLEEGIEELHKVLDQWMEQSEIRQALGVEGSRYMRTVTHEWIANLIRHAEFESADPEVRLSVIAMDGSLRIEIRDNSNGFDLDYEKEQRKGVLDRSLPPDRQLGIPLMMECADDLQYQQDEDGLYVAVFVIE